MNPVIVFLLILIWPTIVLAEEGNDPGLQPENEQTANDAWQRATTPNENHKLLGIFVGDWTYNFRSWSSPGAKPQESSGTAQNRWAMGERYLIQQTRSNGEKKPFEGLGITGFDNISNQYVSTWVDNTSSGLMKATATFDPKTNTFNESGTIPGQKGEPFRAEWKIIDASHYRYTMYLPTQSHKEFKSLEVTYTRR